MFTDSQIRSKLKEFAQYYKKGENTGWWKLKSHLVLPDEDGIRKVLTPESVFGFNFSFACKKVLWLRSSDFVMQGMALKILKKPKMMTKKGSRI